MIVLAVAVAAATLAVGLPAAMLLRRLPTLRLQLAGLALGAVVLPLAAVLVSGLVMFHAAADVQALAVAATAATVAVAAALLLARSVSRHITNLRHAAQELESGDLTARAPGGGPRELQQLSRAFNQMAENLARLFDARRELVAWASHDLRTPLASLQAMIEALEDGLAAPAEYSPALREQVRILGTLVDQLFELSRIDAGLLNLQIREAHVGSLVESCLQVLKPEADTRKVRLTARVSSTTAVARCAPEKVERVLFNLVTNALRYTPSDGSIVVVVAPVDGQVMVSVEDSGQGIPVRALQRAFDPFWREDPARTRTSAATDGSGLGLAIARGLVEAQGGKIWAENRPEGGARVAFTLPSATAGANK